MLLCSSVSYPNLVQKVKIIFAVGGATDPFKRSYSKMLCYKNRNKLTADHMAMQYLLSFLLKSMDLIMTKLVHIRNPEKLVFLSRCC